MSKKGVEQRRLVFAEAELWTRLPESRRQRCRRLLGRLLREVVIEERRPRSADRE